jgi:hypothetical protein
LDLAGVEAQHAVDDPCVLLEEVQTAVCSPLVQSELYACSESQQGNVHAFFTF